MPRESSPLVECVPNFSEGRDQAVIEALANSIRRVKGARLLGLDSGADVNRSVYTFAGAPEAVADAAVSAARTAYELIDMARQAGEHPRMGALDVCPFVPLSGIDLAGCAALADGVARRIAEELRVPVYLYEASAQRPERRSLAALRAGEYESLAARMAQPEWAPDYGPAAFVPRWGASVVGAREFLIAYNVNLTTGDAELAKEVARRVRESGRAGRDGAGKPVRVPGRLKAVRAIGWYIEAYGCAQVSTNLVDFRTTPLHEVYEAVAEEAKALGTGVAGSEIIGLVPREAILQAGRHFEPSSEGDGLVQVAIRALGLDSVAAFEPRKRIVEYAVEALPLGFGVGRL
jgi:glutamate formiminotransferase / formiminotetrahydrofolate cyclodeaminase